MNRNGRFDTNGVVANVDNSGLSLGTTSFQIGDPEWIGVLEHPDQPYGPNNKFIARYAFIALPVGNGLDLNAIHNQTFDTVTGNRSVNPPPVGGGDVFFRNQGVGSWEINLAAFLADLNTNQWGEVVGSYPNFPAGSANWYQYNQANPTPSANVGTAFEDARALLAYRYNNTYNSLATVQNLFGNTGAAALQNDDIDSYSDGPLQTTFDTNAYFFINNDNPTLPWAGSDNTNHFFTPSDLFDTTKTEKGVTPPGFTEHLQQTGANVSTYDRYTFYRLLSQLGTDSTPEANKMNLNYANVNPSGGIVPNMQTNFISWTPLQFFTNAADRMLRAYSTKWFQADPTNYLITYYGVVPQGHLDASGMGVTNVQFFGQTNQIPAFGVASIPVYVNGQFDYTPAVNRVLQLAANIYDATVNNRVNGSPDYPDVFRPLFLLTGTNLYIRGYTNLNNSGVPNTVSGPADLQLSVPSDVSTIISTVSVPNVPSDVNIYGVPWIIGAKKGFPNFNEFSMENNLAVTRRLQLTRTTNSSTPVITSTNQMYMMSLSSSLGVELWNSYSASYPGTVVIGLNENASLTITNDEGFPSANPGIIQPMTFGTNYSFTTNFSGAAPWFGGNPNSASFVLPLNVSVLMLTNSVYRSPFATGATVPPGLTAPSHFSTRLLLSQTFTPPSTLLFESNSLNGFHFPQFGVVLTNHLQVFMLDLTNGVYHVIDYVHFAGPDSTFNVNASLADVDLIINGIPHSGVWDTSYPAGSSPPTGPTYGILNQIAISKNGAPPLGEDGLWQADPEALPANGTIAQQQAFFQAFFKPGNRTTTPVAATNLQLSVQAPYSPTRNIVQYLTWQVNDPLVHYLASDIDYTFAANGATIPQPGVNHYNAGQLFSGLTNLNLGFLNDRYMPWGGQPKFPVDPNPYNSALKDPLVASSDNWDFPTNKFPTVGWLGRVHRGTPWQTVYLKASDILAGGVATWTNWTGNLNYFDATNTAPVQDRHLFDLFTTAFNDNATRGQLSVNVAAGNPDPAAGLAAWSALFSGVVVPTSLTNSYTVIQPAGTYNATLPLTNQPPLAQIVAAINSTRAGTNADGLSGAFEHTGDILRTPQLTEQSPFLAGLNATNQINDEMYEWLPQQTMSLLRLGSPRYVIYSYGQTLKPAPNGIVTSSGPFFGMVTNYQVVSETATRAVVRFDSAVTNINNTLTVTNNRAVIENYNILPPD